MTWKPPETDREWDECLSAYADGELAPDEAEALVGHLKHDAERAMQLDSLKAASALLTTWKVDAPPPSAAIRATLEKRDKSSSLDIFPKRMPLQYRGLSRLAAAFALGVLAGGWFMSPSSPSQPETARVVHQSIPEEAPMISKEQATAVFKEVEALALMRRVREAARNGDWKSAVEGFERMRTEYGETRAAMVFSQDSMSRRIVQRSFQGRS